MSDTAIEESPASQGGKKISKVSDIVIRLAGNSQDGIQSIGGFLARLAGRSEQEVMTFMTIPSTISGGPSIFQVRIGSGEVLSAGDDADVLVAFYQHSYENHLNSLREGGLLVYDSDHVTPLEEHRSKFHHIPIPISSMTVEAIGGSGKDKGKNIYTLGLITKMFDLNRDKLVQLISERLKSKGEDVFNTAVTAFEAGFSNALENVVETFELVHSSGKSSEQVVMTGNEALAYGLIAAGVRFGAGYPITPWSDIMELLRKELPKYGGKFIQCEDEIAAVSMALGASFAGRVSVTGSSGPGISLKTEAIGWGVMAEMPLIIVDVQRGGPSTGLPTNVEQSDLNIALFGGHGDSPRVVLAPANVEDAFYTAIEAVQIANKYNVPVFILTDQSIATRIEAFEEPDLETICQDLTPDLTPVDSYKPYDLEALNGATPRKAPGTRILDGKYPVATGLEHDEMGHPSGAPAMHKKMVAKRRNKLRKLASEIKTPEVYGGDSGDALIVGWGSTMGPIREATDLARSQGLSFSALHIKHINPLPEGLESAFENFKQIFVVELNDEGPYGYGQFASLLRARYANPKIQSICKTDGLTYKVKEIVSLVQDRIQKNG
jgi:2-oxoglutarate ferredoxin oxidoreductase subunit alpha